MSANTIDTTTYNNVAANTVFNAVIDATVIAAWRQNVKNVVNQHATEIDGKVNKTGDTMTGLLTLKADSGIAFGNGGIIRDQTGNRTVMQANNDTFDVITESGANFIFQASYVGSAPIFKGNILYHAGISGPFFKGAGSPEGVVTAVVGAIYQRTDGSTTTTLYVKTSGTGNTGWTAK